MRHHTDRYRVELDVDAGAPRLDAQPIRERESAAPGEGPFCIALLGDFGGRTSRGEVERGSAVSSRRILRVDRDSVDAAIARLSPELRFSVSGAPLTIRFRELDDFHPDRLYERVPHFEAIRAAVEVAGTRAVLPSPEGRSVTAGTPAGRSTAPGRGSLLDDILGDAPVPPGGPAALPDERSGAEDSRGDLDELVRRIVEPHILPAEDPVRRGMTASADGLIVELMRALLHAPDFQALESLWRGVSFLVRRLETDEDLRVFLIDVSRDELMADLASGRPDQESAIRRLLVESAAAAGVERWALLVGNYSFGPEPEDATLLGRLARLSRAADAPFVAGADARLVGSPSFGRVQDPDDWEPVHAEAWSTLREGESARWVGLAAPRFLLRAPYGRETDECERLAFEELESASGGPTHEHYLWGNPALVCAELLGEAFSRSGWELHPRPSLGGLPLHVYQTADGPVATPCAEALLTERALERLLEEGIMPLAWIRDSDSVRLLRIQSIATPLAPLAGGWR